MAKDALVQELVDGFDDWPAQPRLEEPASPDRAAAQPV